MQSGIVRSLKIIKSSDPHYWYTPLIGQMVPFLREYDDCYMSREPEGFANIVRKEDAEIIEEKHV
jgi:hypothetical protein